MTIREDFLSALNQLSKATTNYEVKTKNKVVLVGGAATAIYTDGSFNSNDFDLIACDDDEFEKSMSEFGFIKEDRSGYLMVGWYHPDHENYGFQLVTGPLFEGRTSKDKMVTFSVSENSIITLPPFEDMIADRLAQHAIASPTDPSRLYQAKALLKLAPNLDLEYLLKRIREEGGDPSLLGINGSEMQL